jgi:hypothetical protein
MTEKPQARRDRPEAGPVVHNRLLEEVERLKGEPAWRDGDRNAITLTKSTGLRLVLTVLRQGAVLREHRAPSAATLHVISGRIVLHAGDRSLGASLASSRYGPRANPPTSTRTSNPLRASACCKGIG